MHYRRYLSIADRSFYDKWSSEVHSRLFGFLICHLLFVAKFGPMVPLRLIAYHLFTINWILPCSRNFFFCVEDLEPKLENKGTSYYTHSNTETYFSNLFLAYVLHTQSNLIRPRKQFFGANRIRRLIFFIVTFIVSIKNITVHVFFILIPFQSPVVHPHQFQHC